MGGPSAQVAVSIATTFSSKGVSIHLHHGFNLCIERRQQTSGAALPSHFEASSHLSLRLYSLIDILPTLLLSPESARDPQLLLGPVGGVQMPASYNKCGGEGHLPLLLLSTVDQSVLAVPLTRDWPCTRFGKVGLPSLGD